MVTNSPLVWRLIDSGIVSPEYSAASDEAILNARVGELAPNTVHFYIRDSPTVSIGYNESVTDSVSIYEAERRNVKIIRRFSGGRAVYTDQGQLIFALVIDNSFLPSDLVESYARICSAIVRGLSFLGVKAEYKPVNDVLVNGLKISGSAQLRRGAITLHHGTMMVDTDLAALAAIIPPSKNKKGDPMSSKGVTCLSMMGKAPDMHAVKEALIKGIGEIFGVTLYPRGLTPAEIADIDLLIEEKYDSRDWNWRL